MKKNERTLQMEKNFLKLNKTEGRSIKKIAEIYGLSESTIYKRLGIIAEREGVTREYLLEHPHVEHNVGARQYDLVEPIDVSDLTKKLATLNEDFNAVINSMKKEIRKQEKYLEE